EARGNDAGWRTAWRLRRCRGQTVCRSAGKIMDRALEEAGIDRSQVYVTNAVKHFKWEPRGNRRIHQKPNSREIAACRPWLEAELRIVNPNLVVAMARQRHKRFSAQASGSPGSAARYCPQSSHPKCLRLFIHRRFFANPTRNRASANTSISLPICAPQ